MEYFILGIVFLTIILPICEQIGIMICGAFEIIKSYFSFIVIKINSKTTEYKQSIKNKNTIGFFTDKEDDND